MDTTFAGVINTAYLTHNMPRWAGAAQNLIGTDLQGRPVLPTNATPDTTPLDLLKQVNRLQKRLRSIENKIALLEAKITA
ncbi:IX [Bat mastadenovirus WIV13]|uniref:IX n=1 Tax=Bat mastadenovirus WIV13 TaxID=1788435 RepID=A0A1B0UHW4_9ADEN|nr:IX [Bat mastadenovirus WIV13]AMB43020.1 IX [Bat mastadenovirus WIV13]